MELLFKKRKRIINILLLIASLIFLFLVRLHLKSVLTPFIYALILAYVLNPLVSIIERKTSRIPAILIVFLGITAIMSGVFMSFVPRLAQDISIFATDIPRIMANAENYINDLRSGELIILPEFMNDFIDIEQEINKVTLLLRNSLFQLTDALIASTGTLLNIIMTPIITFYYLKDKEIIMRSLFSCFDNNTLLQIKTIAKEIDKVLGGFIKGQLIVAGFVGILTGLGCYLIGVPYALTVGLVAGVTNIIPYFGPWIGGILPVALALASNPISALWVLIWIIVVQQIESSFISPQVLSYSVGLHPLLVMFSVLFFGSLIGIPGMILGVPITGTIKVLGRYLLVYKNEYFAR
jgi:predicted PurR-regulated permease PerM